MRSTAISVVLLQMERKMERGTGKTTRLLAATPGRGVYIVQNSAMKYYVEQWIRDNGRANEQIKVVPVENLQSLKGYRGPISVDHTVLESLDLFGYSIRTELLYQLRYAPLVLKTDPEGNVVTWWRGA